MASKAICQGLFNLGNLSSASAKHLHWRCNNTCFKEPQHYIASASNNQGYGSNNDLQKKRPPPTNSKNGNNIGSTIGGGLHWPPKWWRSNDLITCSNKANVDPNFGIDITRSHNDYNTQCDILSSWAGLQHWWPSTTILEIYGKERKWKIQCKRQGL